MWPEIARHLPEFESAVLTGLDAAGYPFSVRCRPQLDRGVQVLRLELSADLPIQPGPAGLLCHRHDEQLWNQQSFLLRGTLVQDAAGWSFRPSEFIPGIGIGGVLGMVRFVIGARRRAGQYLKARGLPRPRIPWDAIDAVKARAE